MSFLIVRGIDQRHSRLARPAQPSLTLARKQLPAAHSEGLALALPLHHVEMERGILDGISKRKS